jgi:hypothetical protein
VAEPVPVTFHGSIDYTTFIVGLDAKNGPRGKVLELNRTDDLDYVQNIVQGAACSIEAKRNSEKFKPKHIYEGVAQAVRLAQSLEYVSALLCYMIADGSRAIQFRAVRLGIRP